VTDLTGQVLAGRYRILRELGSGGMGTVYLAEHVYLGRPTAVKLLRPELAWVHDADARFRREALLAARINRYRWSAWSRWTWPAAYFEMDTTPIPTPARSRRYRGRSSSGW
jgi:hypothetical protein